MYALFISIIGLPHLGQIPIELLSSLNTYLSTVDDFLVLQISETYL